MEVVVVDAIGSEEAKQTGRGRRQYQQQARFRRDTEWAKWSCLGSSNLESFILEKAINFGEQFGAA